jgi:hypothetical protein
MNDDDPRPDIEDHAGGRQCHACTAPVRVAHAPDGDTIVLDRDPIGRRGEITAMVEGRATWTLGPHGLTRRTAGRGLLPVPPNTVWADHLCSRLPLGPGALVPILGVGAVAVL